MNQLEEEARKAKSVILSETVQKRLSNRESPHIEYNDGLNLLLAEREKR